MITRARIALTALIAAIMIPTVAAMPARAATATFPVVADCSPFTDFYNSWQPLPHELYAVGTRWVPQGLAYDPVDHWLIISYYDGRDGVATADKYPSMLVATTLSGRFVKHLVINTADVGPGGHAGGLGVGHHSLYISSTDHGTRVTRIPLGVIGQATDGSTLPDSTSYQVAAASYATVAANGDLYVGDFENDLMYRYRTNHAGDPVSTPTTYPTPTLVQGVAVADDEFIFSRSYGRTRESFLSIVDRRTGSQNDVVMPNMLEGISWAPASRRGRGTDLYTLFESGSAAYGAGDDGGATTCSTTHLWHRPETALP
jgi:hypothetical protein